MHHNSRENRTKRAFHDMFRQVTHILQQTLDRIGQVYNKHNIRFQIKHHLQTVMRILTPYELRGIVDNREVCYLLGKKQDMFDLFHEEKSLRKEEWDEQEKQAEKLKIEDTSKNKNGQSSRTNQFSHKSFHKDTKTSFHHDNFQSRDNHQYQFMNREQYSPTNVFGPFKDKFSVLSEPKKIGVRSRGLQQALCQWIKQNYEKGVYLGRSEVLEKTREIGKSCNLKASTGWYSKFINRNKDIKEILSFGNRNKKQNGPIIQNNINRFENNMNGKNFSNLSEDEDFQEAIFESNQQNQETEKGDSLRNKDEQLKDQKIQESDDEEEGMGSIYDQQGIYKED